MPTAAQAIGLWKFGFPETLATLLHFWNKRNGTRLNSLNYFIDGLGLLVHHLSTALVLTGLMLHMLH